jgi:hypothetical protein
MQGDIDPRDSELVRLTPEQAQAIEAALIRSCAEMKSSMRPGDPVVTNRDLHFAKTRTGLRGAAGYRAAVALKLREPAPAKRGSPVLHGGRRESRPRARARGGSRARSPGRSTSADDGDPPPPPEPLAARGSRARDRKRWALVADAICPRPAGGRFDVSEAAFEPHITELDERVAQLERQLAQLRATVAALGGRVEEVA